MTPPSLKGSRGGEWRGGGGINVTFKSLSCVFECQIFIDKSASHPVAVLVSPHCNGLALKSPVTSHADRPDRFEGIERSISRLWQRANQRHDSRDTSERADATAK